MKIITDSDAEAVKVFSINHRNQTIELRSFDEDKGATFKANLTLYEFQAVCDFITKNFKNDGKQ